MKGNEIKLLSKVWEIKPKPNIILTTNKAKNTKYCCKILSRNNKEIIIYFDIPGRAIGSAYVKDTKNMFELVKVCNIKPELIKLVINKYLQKLYDT